MFVTAQNFNDTEYNLPDLNKKVNSFQNYVDEQEEELLYKVLGMLLYEEFKVHMLASALSVDPIPLPQRWADLKNGVKYLYKEKTFRWLGMTKLFTPYIYSQWTNKMAVNQNGAGTSVPKVENSTVISPTRNVAKAFNVASKMTGHGLIMRDTLFGYLYNSGDKYVDVVASEYSNIQEYMRLNYKDPGLANMFNL